MANNFTTPLATSHGNNCDLYAHHSTARVLMPLHYSLVFIIGLVGNLLALVVIVQNRKKINSTTLYSMNLVISDILFTTALPTRIAYYALGFDWRIGDALCRVTALVFYINTYAGVNFMTCLSIDRFFAVVHPLREKSGVNKKALNTIILIIVVFILCFTPYHVAIIQHMIKMLCSPGALECGARHSFQISLHFTVCLMNFNCCMDPFIYFFACKGYKRKVMKMLKRQVSVSISSAVRSAPEENSREMTESQMMIHSKASNGR